ncbi:actin [Dendroctonus ponderosae]|uniref:actin n=1 Tax=Dendroctonus ponderosae TaxID=77166 RepID=UPI0020356A98|nr:actin [Dendroctonus ponderosae]KAH1026099.1 hypothetical protein HUJ05_010677 [Dendroctonus ponderosae]
MGNHLKQTIVIDLGSGDTKVGLAEEDYPSCTIPTRISCDESTTKGFYFDQSAISSEECTYPIHHGIIQNFEHVESLLEHVFSKELCLKPQDHPLLLTQPPKNPQRDKEKLAEMMFEKFAVPALYEEIHSVLTFNAAGRSTALIVESGHGVTSVVPILSGYVISDAVLRLDVGGGDIDQYLAKILSEKSQECEIRPEEARILKENLCYVPDCGSAEIEEESYLLPDGRRVVLGQERVLATNPLFQPFLVEQYDTPGIHEMIFQSIFKCSVDLRRAFANNVILSGGNTLFNGIEDRLKQELETRVPPTMKVNVIASKDRNIFVWRGGSILGSLSTFVKNICISRTEYEEFGISVIRKKCANQF